MQCVGSPEDSRPSQSSPEAAVNELATMITEILPTSLPELPIQLRDFRNNQK